MGGERLDSPFPAAHSWLIAWLLSALIILLSWCSELLQNLRAPSTLFPSLPLEFLKFLDLGPCLLDRNCFLFTVLKLLFQPSSPVKFPLQTTSPFSFRDFLFPGASLTWGSRSPLLLRAGCAPFFGFSVHLILWLLASLRRAKVLCCFVSFYSVLWACLVLLCGVCSTGDQSLHCSASALFWIQRALHPSAC